MKIYDFIEGGGDKTNKKTTTTPSTPQQKQQQKKKNVSFREKHWGEAGAWGKSRGEEKVIKFPPNAEDRARLRALGTDNSM